MNFVTSFIENTCFYRTTPVLVSKIDYAIRKCLFQGFDNNNNNNNDNNNNSNNNNNNTVEVKVKPTKFV